MGKIMNVNDILPLYKIDPTQDRVVCCCRIEAKWTKIEYKPDRTNLHSNMDELLGSIIYECGKEAEP